MIGGLLGPGGALVVTNGEVGRERQGAIDDINAGNEALDKAYKDFDEGKIDMAQSHYDKAIISFQNAAAILD